MNDHIGELAALGTSLCFSFGSILFTVAGRDLGSRLLNRARLLIALLFIVALHWLSFGQPFPTAETDRWFWLGLSGFVGFTLGDTFLFQGFVTVGPRISMLMMSFSPALSIILAWIFLGEQLTLIDLVITVVIIGGIAWVVSERTATAPDAEPISAADSRKRLIGILFAFGGAVGQAGGLILSKLGLAGDFPALSGTLMRLLIATASIWLWEIATGGLSTSIQTLRRHPRAMRYVVVACLFGPVAGVYLSLVAVQRAPVGIASTLSSLAPIFLLPISYFAFGEKITPRAVIGTVVVIAATALLFLDIIIVGTQ